MFLPGTHTHIRGVPLAGGHLYKMNLELFSDHNGTELIYAIDTPHVHSLLSEICRYL